MPYPPFPFPFSYLPEGMKKQLEAYSNNPYADIKMPGSMMPGSKNNPMVNPTGVPVYDEETGMEILDDTAIPLSRYKLQNLPNIVKNIEDARNPFATYGDMNKEGVLLQKDIPTPELDMLMGKTETPYTMDYVPFASEEEMLRQTNPPPPDPLNPEPINIQTLDATGINNLAKDMPLPGAKQYPAFHGEYERMRQLAKDEAIVAEENKPKELPAFHGEYERAKEQARKEYWQNYKPIEIPFTPFKGQIPNDIDIENLAKDMPLPPGNTPTNTTNPTNPLVQNPKNKFGTPEAYYLGKSMLDATALINNMVQPQPPSIQMKLPHYERQRLNPEPYDTMRSQMRDQGTQAYRLQRENISQASDLMKGLAAVTSGTQQGLMQVGMQQAGAEQQMQGINQQISMQEQGQQTEILNQEATTNYQIQQQAQQVKDQMVSAQLNRLGDTAGAYSDYVAKKELSQKMTDLSKEQADKGNAIQLAMLKYQAGQNELGSDAYKEAQKQNINQYISETKTNLLADPKYTSLGPNYDPLTFSTRENSLKNLEQRMNLLSESYNGFTEEPQKPTRTAEMTEDQWKATEADFEKRKWRYDSDKERYTIAKKQYDLEKPKIDLERSFIGELTKSYDIAGKRTEFQSDWFKKRGLKTIEEVLKEVETLVNPNRQIFK